MKTPSTRRTRATQAVTIWSAITLANAIMHSDRIGASGLINGGSMAIIGADRLERVQVGKQIWQHAG
jgi:hypothetical protein